jgi:Septum formation
VEPSVLLRIDADCERRRVVAKSDDWSMAMLDEDFVRGARVQELSAAERANEVKAFKTADRKARRRHRGRQALGLLAPLAVVGGIVALSTRQHRTDGLSAKVPSTTVVSTSSTSSASVAPTTPPPVPTTAVIGTTTIVLNGGPYAIGDCVKWDQDVATTRQRDVRIVNCEVAHLYEMVGTTVVPKPWNDGPFPKDQESGRMIESACQVLAEKYFGGPIDPFGFLEVTGISPSEQGWLQGYRNIFCGLARRVIDRADFAAVSKGLNVETVGSMRTSDQRFPWKIGDCLLRETWMFRVPCEEPHTYEFVGWGDLSTQAAFPDQNDFTLTDACSSLADAYAPSTPASVTVWNQHVEPGSWAAGTRAFACYLGEKEKQTDGWPVSRVGSVREVTV